MIGFGATGVSGPAVPPKPHSVWNAAGFKKGPAAAFRGHETDESLADGLDGSEDANVLAFQKPQGDTDITGTNGTGNVAAPKPNGHFTPDIARASPTPAIGTAPAPSTAQTAPAPAAVPAHDKEMARRQLAILDPHATKFTFQFFNDRIKGRDANIFNGTFDQAWPKILERNTPSRGIGVFVTVNETDLKGRTSENIVRPRALFADADSVAQIKSCNEVLQGARVSPTMTIRTGRGAHVYFCCDDIPLTQFKSLQEQISAKFGTDSAVKDLPHVMRLAGTLHLKDPANPQLVRLVHVSDSPVWRLSDLMSKLGLSLSAAPKNKTASAKRHNTELTPGLTGAPAAAFAGHETDESLSDGIKSDGWFQTLSSEQKDEVVDYALGIIAAKTKFFEIKANGGDNGMWYRLTTAVAVSGAPHAEDIFIKYASTAEHPDSEAGLREHFLRCQTGADGRITVGTLLLLAQQNGANFDPWKCQAPSVPALPPVTWSATELQVSFSNIPHRRWLYGTYLIRGEITVLAAPGGAGKTALATGIAVEIAAGVALLAENIFGSDLKVLFINGEDGRTEIRRRIWALCLAYANKNIGQHLDRLYVAGANDPHVQKLSFLRTTNSTSSMLDMSGFEILESALDALRPDVLILDPLVAFCGGGNMNDNSVMSQVMRELKRLAAKFDCAILIVHHTRKGRTANDEPAGEAERISGAAAIVNLARRALMPVTMSEAEAKFYSVLPSERHQFFKLVDAKSNLAPLSAQAPWYELASVELPNSEPPTYPNGDRVQAVKRAHLTRQKTTSSLGSEQRTIRFELMKLVERGLMIQGEKAPYSPNSTGNNKKRAILADAMAAIEKALPEREWVPPDLRATVERELEAIKHDGWAIVEIIKTGRFRRSHGLRPAWERTPWATERERLRQHGGPTTRTEEEKQRLDESDSRDSIENAFGPNG
jgi:hypothetical protein